jgi:hypothetical protein
MYFETETAATTASADRHSCHKDCINGLHGCDSCATRRPIAPHRGRTGCSTRCCSFSLPRAAAAADESISLLHLISKSDTQQNRQRCSLLSHSDVRTPLSCLICSLSIHRLEEEAAAAGRRAIREQAVKRNALTLSWCIMIPNCLHCGVCSSPGAWSLHRAEIDDEKETRAKKESDDGDECESE